MAELKLLLHSPLAPVILYAAASAAAHALPEPLPMGSRGYLFFYRFAHLLLANLDRFRKSPQ